MDTPPLKSITVRPINPESPEEIEIVATRMRETLIEVLGEEVGGNMYTLDWLKDRVMFHLTPDRSIGQVYVALADSKDIVGHSIVRVEQEEGGSTVGLFSTTYVAKDFRSHGVASALLNEGEKWMVEHNMHQSVTYTDCSNEKLKNLYMKHGYACIEVGNNFVHLSKAIP